MIARKQQVLRLYQQQQLSLRQYPPPQSPNFQQQQRGSGSFNVGSAYSPSTLAALRSRMNSNTNNITRKKFH